MKAKLVAILVAITICLSTAGVLLTPAFSSPVLALTTWHVYSGDSIQTAINNAASGDTIIVHPGTYHECISVGSSKTNLTIRSSNGAAVTTIDGDGISNVVDIDGDYTTFQGFTVTNAGSGDWGIYVDVIGTIHVTIARSIITHNDGGGLYARVEGADLYLTVTDNTISDNGEGIHVSVYAGDVHMTITNNAITSNSNYGIYAIVSYGDLYITAASNTITGNNGDGIYVDSDGDLYLTATFNTISGNGGKGIYANSDYKDVYMTATRNTISGNNDVGIYAYCGYGDVNMTATSNTISGNNGEGIYAYSWLRNVYITVIFNTVTGNNADGIYPYSDNGNVYLTVTNNTITGNGSDGIDVYACYNMYVTITSNTIAGNDSDGIYIYGYQGEAEGVVRGNTIANNSGDGIYMYSYENCLGIDVIGNKIKNNSYQGIHIQTDCNGIILTISGNFIADNTSDAIFIEGYDTSTAGEADIVLTIVGNTIQNNGGYGIHIYPRLDGVYVANNQIVGNDGGIYFDILYDSNVVLAHSGTHVWYSGCGAYTDKTLTRTFYLRRFSSATLSFWTWYATEEWRDYCYVEINDGSGWVELDSFDGNSNGWEEKSYDISAYAGKMVQIRFRYETNSTVAYRGWYLDDIAISQIRFRDSVEGGQNGWVTSPYGWSIVQLYGNAVRSNAITGNGIGLDYSSSGPELDARYNWWGHYSGPYNPATNPLGKGNSVSSNVIYRPWLWSPTYTFPYRY